jgi:hypothetical protein
MNNNLIKWRQSIDQLSGEIEVNSRISLEKNQPSLENQWLYFWLNNNRIKNTWFGGKGEQQTESN